MHLWDKHSEKNCTVYALRMDSNGMKGARSCYFEFMESLNLHGLCSLLFQMRLVALNSIN